eukprot:CAMPEP_0172448318 /NCGR_PEP_ID=MMETSP1065-20121228/7362_1 /TAXON_ID=265537 /ORGANISM="Amphiprora paludosa, Strain CCMP125" /LENGTH=37 /DNA_ID= /DNA_START= /DNA_END= /DNA_ORIENTATION=
MGSKENENKRNSLNKQSTNYPDFTPQITYFGNVGLDA